jgi:transposase
MNRFDALKVRKLGKSILFTDRFDWTNEKIVGAYHRQYHVEDAFQQMKDTKYLSFRPIYHFTDAYIRVHALYCVIALTLASLFNKEVEALGGK